MSTPLDFLVAGSLEMSMARSVPGEDVLASSSLMKMSWPEPRGGRGRGAASGRTPSRETAAFGTVAVRWITDGVGNLSYSRVPYGTIGYLTLPDSRNDGAVG